MSPGHLPRDLVPPYLSLRRSSSIALCVFPGNLSLTLRPASPRSNGGEILMTGFQIDLIMGPCTSGPSGLRVSHPSISSISSHSCRDADRTTILRPSVLFFSKLNYDVAVYSSAALHFLAIMNPVQNHQTSPIRALLALEALPPSSYFVQITYPILEPSAISANHSVLEFRFARIPQ